jgi:hypothetical protein
LTGKAQAAVCHSNIAFCDGLLRVNLAVYVLDPIDRDEMTMTAGCRVVLGQDNAVVAFLVVDGSDMFAV